MKRKVLCSILAVLIILASVPVTAFAADAVTITKVDLTATKNLIEGYDCHIEYDGQTGEPFNYYYINDTLPDMTLTFSDGSTKDITFDEYYDYFEDPIWCEQGVGEKELKPGTHTKTVCLTTGYDEETDESEGIMAEYTFTIEENPVESISVVATKPFIEGASGYNSEEYDDEGNVVGSYFYYTYESAGLEITVNYKDGDSKTFTYSGNDQTNLLDQTGYDLCFEGDQAQKPFERGENEMAVSYLGVKSTVTFNVIKNPVEKVTIVPTKTIEENKDGYLEYFDYEDETKGSYFWYDISLTKPQITVEYNDGTPTKTCSWDDCYDIFENEPSFNSNQSENPLKVGTNTVKVNFLGKEIDYTFEIVTNPIKSVSLDVRYKLEENRSGYYENQYDDENYIGQYFYYDLDWEQTFVTVEYKDETKEALTFCLDDLSEYFDESIYIDLGGQSYENPLTIGVYTGTVKLNGVEGTFTFEIVENTVKKVEVRATKDLVENQDGWLNGEDVGDTYFYYYPKNLYPEFTVTFADGTVKVYSFSQLDGCGYNYDYSIEQSAENPLKPGTHTGTASFNGVETTFTFKILEDPVKNVVLTPTRDLIQYTDGYNTEGSDDSWFFWYDIDRTQPTVTINYKDGSSETYTYEEIIRYTDFDVYIEDYQDSDSQLKVGTNKTTAYVNGTECEYTFNLKKAEKTVTSLSVVPEGKLVENIGGYFSYNGDSEEFYVYYPYTITYTVTAKYSDGTTKTYKGVRPYKQVDGSDFDIYFEGRTYSDRFTVGKNNTGVAYYKNATCTFNVEVIENDFKSIEISGDNNFVLTLVKQDGTKVNLTAKSFEIMGMGVNELGIMLTTDKGEIDLVLNYNFNEDGTSLQNISALLGNEESGLKSNTLASNKWLDMMIAVNNIAHIAPTYANGDSEHYYGRDFKGINGTITGALVDDALTMCSSEEYYYQYENRGTDEKGRYAILSLEEAKELLKYYFDPSKVDITTSPMYNAPAQEIKVYFMPYFEGGVSNEKLECINGKFTYTAEWQDPYTYEITPVTVVLANTGYIESISFTKGECGDIKTINASNAKNGVKVTYSASENAVEYEIHRSTNGGKYEKVGTTAELSFVDTTVVSGKTYTYKVRGVNPTDTGAFSGTKTVSYLAMPKTTATISKTGFTVKWNKVDGAATYRIYRAQYTNGKWSDWSKLSDQKASVTSFADKNVKAGGIYKYTVRALASGGAASAYEGTATLVYLTTPTVKIANAKGGVKVTWNAVSGAQSYIVYRAEYNASAKKWSSWSNLGTAKASTKAFADKTAVSGKTYRYTVRAVNGDNKSLYTASSSLLYLAEPTVTIANAKAGITVKWTKSGGATGYIVYRATYNASTKKWSGWSNMGTVKATTSWTDKSVKSGTAYKYTVRAINDKVASSFTASASLIRLAQTTVKISNAKTGVTVKWSKVTGAKNYVVYRAELVNGKWSSWKNMGTKANNVLSWTDASALSGKTYRYTVRAVNGSSKSSYTASNTTLFLAEPTTKIQNAAKGIKVSWTAADGAQGYTVYRSEYNAKTKKWSGWVNRGTVKGKTSWTDTKVTSGTYYKYTVRAISGSYKSTYTASAKLLYLAQPTVTAAKATNGVAVKWNKITGATSYIVYRQEMTDGAWSSWKTLGTVKSGVISYTDKAAEAEKEYRYTVRAVNGSYKSSYNASSSVKR